ncbi:MAG TPA: HAMP domain-containing histidine kinase, partial [Alphaproteobacteria bacterium]|nr:HAMP domain-containing histidine kinase [Alphaproteobacteria bacterium]
RGGQTYETDEVDETNETTGAAGRRGAGLGLSLVKRFVELHDGAISIKSRPGKGTSVIVRLPAPAEGRPPAAGKGTEEPEHGSKATA